MAVKSVKLFVGDEIRRFPIEVADGNLKYESLVQKVAKLYPNVSMVKLAWKDEDNDLVAIANDDDVKEVIRHANGEVLRIHLVSTGDFGLKVPETNINRVNNSHCHHEHSLIENKPPIDEDDNEKGKEEIPDPTLHIGVTCDGCSGVVKGLRFKCLVCQNYDLCETCESKHTHNDHPMIRIASPVDKSWRNAYFASIHQHPTPMDHRRFQDRCRHGGRHQPPTVESDQCRANSDTNNESKEEREERDNFPLFGTIMADVLDAINELVKEEESEKNDVGTPIIGEVVTAVVEPVVFPTEKSQAENQEEVNPSLHVGISCDGCNGPVQGMRFKCIVCPDFDLCETCQSSHKHHEHPMICIASAKDKSWKKAFFAQGCRGPAHLHPHSFHTFHPFPFGYFGQRVPCCGGHGTTPKEESKKKPAEEMNDQCKKSDAVDFGEILIAVLDAAGINIQTLGGLEQEEKLVSEDKVITKEEQLPVQNSGTKSTVVEPTLSEATGPKVVDPLEKIQEAFDQMLATGFVKDDTDLLRSVLLQSKGSIAAVLELLKKQEQKIN